MKSPKTKDSKEQYENVVKIVKRAEKAAERFIEQNKKEDPQIRLKYI